MNEIKQPPKFHRIFKNPSIATKFTALLVVILLGGVVVSGVFLWQALQTQAQNEIITRAQLLTETMNSVRAYTSNNVNPLLKDDLETSAEFIPESVPAFSAREVFERFRKNEKYKSFFYTEASDNPFNERNRADDFEMGLIEQMRADSGVEQLTGYRTLFGQEVFYIARPMRVGNESCLTCHGAPADAPANLIATYGDDSGFHWKMNQVIAAQMIYVPANDVLGLAARHFWSMIGIFVIVIALVFVVFNVLLRRVVITPVKVMGELAHQVGEDEDMAEFQRPESMNVIGKRGDELGQLARLLNQMVDEIVARTRSLKNQLRSLQIEIDEMKKQEEVEGVVNTEFFQDLQARAKNLRKKRDAGEDEE